MTRAEKIGRKPTHLSFLAFCHQFTSYCVRSMNATSRVSDSTDDEVIGVMAMDFTMSYVYEILLQHFPRCQQDSNRYLPYFDAVTVCSVYVTPRNFTRISYKFFLFLHFFFVQLSDHRQRWFPSYT